MLNDSHQWALKTCQEGYVCLSCKMEIDSITDKFLPCYLRPAFIKGGWHPLTEEKFAVHRELADKAGESFWFKNYWEKVYKISNNNYKNRKSLDKFALPPIVCL